MAGLFPRKGILDEADDHHENRPPDTRPGNVASKPAAGSASEEVP